MSSLEELVSGCSEIVVAIKPYGFEKLLGGLDAQLKYHDPLIISIAAGKTIETISSYLSYEPALVRVMPNINATIGASMSAYCANGRVSAEQKAFVAKLCSSIGEAVELDENSSRPSALSAAQLLRLPICSSTSLRAAELK